ncbi:putative beta-lysine N-acetyltransferase [Cytobacillus spongiae]|uniref:putative beta-lysine N-acetyltransferase n=1 Tax=Cytobacillus spongiae TaxID=2901381 RepID=UPI003D7A463E
MNQFSYTSQLHEQTFTMDLYIDPFNKRVRVDDYLGDLNRVMEKAEEIAAQQNAEKLIFKARKEHFTPLMEHGFQPEAMIDQFYLGSDCYFFAKYFTADRKMNDHWIAEDDIVENVQKLARSTDVIQPPMEYVLKRVEMEDAEKLAALYREVFQIYPTPLHDPEYIVKTMEEGTIYYAFQYDGIMVSAASAEVNSFYKNAELTDCATLPSHRKHGLMKILLEKLEEELKENGIFCAYSIARALSFGMNAVLHQLGYRYRGRLMNNCFIFDKLENMNMWVKDLSKQ